MIELLQYQFAQNAIFASVLASIVCGLIGVIITEKKLVMMSGGIAHTAYGGVGLGYLMGFNPLWGAIGFAVFASLGAGYIKRKGGAQTDVVIAMMWSLGMALGIAFIGMMPGYPPDLTSYLFGNILSVTKSDLQTMIGITMLVVFVVVILFNDWKSFLFDGEFAAIMGIRTRFLDYVLLVLIALTVVLLIRVAGIILVIALLTAPAATAALLTNKLETRMICASVLGILFCLVGLALSFVFGIASGATIIMVSVSAYLMTALVISNRK